MTARRRLLASLLLIGAALRTAGLPARELSHYDEGAHWRVAYAPAAAARTCLAALLSGRLSDRAELRAAVLAEGFPDDRLAARPGYFAFFIPVMAATGLRDDAGFWVNALAGTLTIGVVWRLGALAGTPRLGSLAALLLAFSPNHIFYSRGGLSQATSALFVYAGLLGLLRRRFFATGLCLGYAFTCHYNLFWLVPCAIGWTWLSGGKPSALAAGAATFPLLFEILSRIASAAVSDWLPGLSPYSHELFHQFSISTGGYSLTPSTSFFYVIHWIRTEGPLFTIGSLAAAVCLLVCSIRKWKIGAGCAIAGLVLLPHLLYAPPALKGARTLLVAVPAACLAAAFALEFLLRRWRGSLRAVAAAALAANLAWTLPLTSRIVEGRGPYRRTIDEIARRGAHPVTVDDYPVLLTYMRGADILAAAREEGTWREPLARIRRAHAQPPLLVAVNRGGRYGFDDPVWRERFGLVRRVVLEEKRRPLWTVPFGHPLAFDYVDPSLNWRRIFSLDDLPYQVEVYDLEGIE